MTEVGNALHEFFETGSVSDRLRFEMALLEINMESRGPLGGPLEVRVSRFSEYPGAMMFVIEDVFSQPGGYRYRRVYKTHEERVRERWIRDASTDALRRAGFKIDTVEND